MARKVRPNSGEPWNPIKKFEDSGKLLMDFNQRMKQFTFIKDLGWEGNMNVFRKSERICRSLAFDGPGYSGGHKVKKRS